MFEKVQQYERQKDRRLPRVADEIIVSGTALQTQEAVLS